MTSETEPAPRPPSLFEALVPVAALIVLVALSYFLFGDAGAKGPNQVALTVAAMIAVLMAARRGWTMAELTEAASASVASGIGAIFILFAVGALIGSWALSGTLLAMVYYGLKLLDPGSFYVTSAALCAVVSLAIGSSWTVVGTIGVGLMGISANMGLDPAISAAAIISGAYFGDTTSPLSDSANLAAASAGAPLCDHMRATLPISLAALAVTLAVFWLLGTPGAADTSEKLAAIAAVAPTSLVIFLPFAVVILLALLRLPPFTTIFAGAITACILAVALSPARVLAFAAAPDLPVALALLKGAWLALASGYVSTSGNVAIDAIASRGGMESMLPTIWLVMSAFAFGGIVEKTGVLEKIVATIAGLARTAASLVAGLVAAIFASNVVTADQYLSIVLPGRMFRPEFEKRGLSPLVLSRSVGAAATPTSALVPWNSCGAYMAATLGVATLAYAPFAVFGIASPLIAILVAAIAARTGKARSR